MNREKVVNTLSALVLLFAQLNLNAAERQRVIQLFIQLDADSE